MGKPVDYFFSKKDVETLAPIKIDKSRLAPYCKECGMYKGCKYPRLNYTGNGRLRCLIVAEANGPDEDYVGKQLVGSVGKFFREQLDKRKLDLDEDFWKMNAVNCYPRDPMGNIRAPNRTEIKHCRPMIEKAIDELNPKFIWLMGGKAVESFYMDYFSKLAITRWRRLCIPDRKTGAHIIPLFHPSYPRRNDDPNLDAVYDSDLTWAISCLRREPHTWSDEAKDVKILNDLNTICSVLTQVIKDQPSHFYLDYETNCLKAQGPGPMIATMSFTTREHGTYAFPYQYADYFSQDEQRRIKRLWRQILKDPTIGKLAHNMKFEHSWSYNVVGIKPVNWIWDTMIAAHILDCRSKFTGLKFQSYINFGVLPYDRHMKSYLHSTARFNKVHDAPLKDLLLYNGLDTLYGLKLYDKQLESFTLSQRLHTKNKLSSALSFFHEGTLALAEIQENGIPIDEDYYYDKFMSMGEDINRLKGKLLASEEAKKFKEYQHKNLDLDSSQHIGILFYDVLGMDPILTEKENYQVDVAALNQLKHPFVDKLLEFRKAGKIRNTYLAQFTREACNKKIYPFFDLNTVITYRSSSSRPNFQNIPIRDEEAQKICRSGIMPSPGNQILESDFSGIEVGTAACYTKDPTLIAHVSDPAHDMHRDAASDIWMLEPDQVSKMVRFYGKNGWVFPEFYGSYYANCAKDLWNNCLDLTTKDGSILIRDHIRDQGIHSYQDFVDHCQSVEDKFWNERFKVYKKWKDDIQIEFQRQGYIETFLGFRYTGYLTYNQATNYPIQGTAFHILLWTLIQVVKRAKEEKWVSKIIGQIHDSILTDLYPPEREHVIETINYFGTVRIREVFPWIIVPLEIEHEITPINGSWYEKKEV